MYRFLFKFFEGVKIQSTLLCGSPSNNVIWDDLGNILRCWRVCFKIRFLNPELVYPYFSFGYIHDPTCFFASNFRLYFSIPFRGAIHKPFHPRDEGAPLALLNSAVNFSAILTIVRDHPGSQRSAALF